MPDAEEFSGGYDSGGAVSDVYPEGYQPPYIRVPSYGGIESGGAPLAPGSYPSGPTGYLPLDSREGAPTAPAYIYPQNAVGNFFNPIATGVESWWNQNKPFGDADQGALSKLSGGILGGVAGGISPLLLILLLNKGKMNKNLLLILMLTGALGGAALGSSIFSSK